MKQITEYMINEFKISLIEEEKSESTLDKYVRDVTAFMLWLKGEEASKGKTLEYKKLLKEKYAPASVNSMISSLNSFFEYKEWYECKIKTIKIQRQIFASKDKELTKSEYQRLLSAARAKKDKRLYYLIETLCSAGLRVSELKYVDVAAVREGQAVINCKGKMRVALLTKELCRELKKYIKEKGIISGPVFVSKMGRALDRSNIWKMLKALCDDANVQKSKVFPHNLRHLFARTYYSVQKDIVRLADILGHSNINTTRIYTMESSDIHRHQLERLRLII